MFSLQSFLKFNCYLTRCRIGIQTHNICLFFLPGLPLTLPCITYLGIVKNSVFYHSQHSSCEVNRVTVGKRAFSGDDLDLSQLAAVELIDPDSYITVYFTDELLKQRGGTKGFSICRGIASAEII